MIRVTSLSTTPVKGLRLRPRAELTLGLSGVADNRCFFLIDDRNRMLNGKQVGALCTVVADYDLATHQLSMRFPDQADVTGEVKLGDSLLSRFFSSPLRARLVVGPWADALSAYAGRPLRLVAAADPDRSAIDRGAAGAVSVISQASVVRLEQLAGDREVDPRRFRMLIEVDGPRAHEEDDWVGRQVRIGEALVAMRGHVGRCLVTTQDPDTGTIDLPVLDMLRSYRSGAGTTEPLAFGIYGEVLEPGAVRVGDLVTLD
jgi:uncharacterized protein YcbX